VTASREPDVSSRRGRPPGTSARALELIALRLFSEHGFAETTVDEIAAEAGVSRRTFFRYYDSKAEVLWSEFDHEVAAIERCLAAAPPERPIMDAVREAVIAVNHYQADDVAELRTRMNLIGSVPELAASAATHYDAWERAIASFVARRTGQTPDSLYPRTVGLATLATCRAAYEQWANSADAELTVYLDAALIALSAGFTDEVLGAGGAPVAPRRVTRKLAPVRDKTHGRKDHA
jgi:TetR/AcrR family transcriptional regulator, regulator of mycofactocin system